MPVAPLLVDEQLRSSKPLEPDELHVLNEAAKWLSKAQLDDAWLDWVATVQSGTRNTASPPAGP